MPNFRMTLSYDGTRYNGWQRQGNTPDTIQGRLEAVLSDLLAQPVEVAGSGRTDAGVHARMQTASFRAKTDGCGRARPDADGVVPREDRPARAGAAAAAARAPAGGHRRAHARGNRAPLSRAPVLPRQDVCLPHLEQRDAERVRAPLCLCPAAAARHGGHAARGGAAVRHGTTTRRSAPTGA